MHGLHSAAAFDLMHPHIPDLLQMYKSLIPMSATECPLTTAIISVMLQKPVLRQENYTKNLQRPTIEKNILTDFVLERISTLT